MHEFSYSKEALLVPFHRGHSGTKKLEWIFQEKLSNKVSLVWCQVEFFSYHSLVKMWRETEKKPVVWVRRAARTIIHQRSDMAPSSSLLLNITLAQMNGFRGCRKGSQGDLLAPTGEISFLPSILQRTRVFSQRTVPHAQQRRGTYKPSLSWDQGTQPACRGWGSSPCSAT